MAEKKHIAKIKLYSSFYDENDRLSIKSILNLFQDVASIHAVDIGVGYLEMLEKNLYWILSRIKFDIIKMPITHSTILIETWPHEKGRIDFDRDFKITTEDGETLIIGTSKWCVIDTESRTLQRTENVNYNCEICPDKNYEDRFTKIMVPSENLTEKFIHTVRFSDLDHNHHMNNTSYAPLVSNAIENKIITHFEINYLNECKLNDEMKIYHHKDETGEYVVGKVEEKTTFTSFVK